MDSESSKDIIAKDIMRALGMRVKEFDRPLRIISATGDSLVIVGTCNGLRQEDAQLCSSQGE